ncbi:unnamed protein product, partial [Polarella glacialis]
VPWGRATDEKMALPDRGPPVQIGGPTPSLLHEEPAAGFIEDPELLAGLCLNSFGGLPLVEAPKVGPTWSPR